MNPDETEMIVLVPKQLCYKYLSDIGKIRKLLNQKIYRNVGGLCN